MNLSPYRATSRIAWRQARRAPWRSALVIALIALPIAALSAGAIGIRSSFSTPESRVRQAMGSADLTVDASKGVDARRLRQLLPPGATVIGRSLLFTTYVKGATQYGMTLKEFTVPLDRPPVAATFQMLEGRPPTRAGEVALSPRMMAAFGVGIGQDLALSDVDLTLHVVGSVVDREDLKETGGVLGPGTLDGMRRHVFGSSYLISLPSGTSPAAAAAALQGGGVSNDITTRTQLLAETGMSSQHLATAGSFAAAALLLLGTALIAGAAFAVGARRQLRTLGLIGAAGGEPRHVRATVVLGGVSLGIVGSLVGVVMGIAVVFALRPLIGQLANRLIDHVVIPVTPLLGAVALGTLAAALSAYGPARSAGRISTIRALAGQAPPPRPPGKLAAWGLSAVVAGAAVMTGGIHANSSLWTTVGVVSMVVGFLVAIPLLVTWVGRLAGALPMVPRLATRDIARHGRRTGAALAAATLVLGLPVAIATFTLSDDARLRGDLPYMASDQLTIDQLNSDAASAERATLLAAQLRRAFPDAVVVLEHPAVATVVRRGKSRKALVDIPSPQQSNGDAGSNYLQYGSLLVGGPDTLRALHAEGGIPALRAGAAIGIGPGTVDGGSIHPLEQDQYGEHSLGPALTAVEAGGTRYADATRSGEFTYVISPERAAQLGFDASLPPSYPTHIILRAPSALDDVTTARVRDIAASSRGAYVLTAADFVDASALMRSLTLLGGGVLALAIVAVVVALVAAESRRDQSILVAVGAAPRIRRAVAGASAATVAVLAAVLAVPVALVPSAVFFRADHAASRVVVPWTTIALVVIAIPLVAGTFGALLSRQPKPGQLLRPVA